ncbi:hypothetical protein ACQY0O_003852 [Thecaphora frezii]
MDSLFSAFQLRCNPADLMANLLSPHGSLGSTARNAFHLRASASTSASSSSSPSTPSIDTPVSSLAPPANTTGLPTPTVDSSEPLLKLELDQGPQRYAAYAARLKTVIASSSRYIAYSSDIGEAFRPLTRPEVVRAAYGISWLYLLGDVSYAGYKQAKLHETLLDQPGPVETAEEKLIAAARALGVDPKKLETMTLDQKTELRKRHLAQSPSSDAAVVRGEGTSVGLVMARRAVFQSIASMALPAFTIHSIVRYSAPVFAKSSRPRVRAAGPTVAGLLFVPTLPFLFDEPVEHAVDLAFDWAQEAWLGRKDSASHDAQKHKQE